MFNYCICNSLVLLDLVLLLLVVRYALLHLQDFLVPARYMKLLIIANVFWDARFDFAQI